MGLKKLVAVLVCVVVLSSLGACKGAGGGAKTAQEDSPYIEKTENKSEDNIFVVYDLFNGADEVPFSLNKDMDMLVFVETQEGALSLAIYERGDTDRAQPFLFQEDLTEESAQFLGSLPKGAYTLVLQGVNHKGSYDITFKPR